MPIYAFRCRKCGHEYEELVPRMGQTVPCPECGHKQVERLVTTPTVGRSSSDSGTCPAGQTPPNCGFS